MVQCFVLVMGLLVSTIANGDTATPIASNRLIRQASDGWSYYVPPSAQSNDDQPAPRRNPAGKTEILNAIPHNSGTRIFLISVLSILPVIAFYFSAFIPGGKK